MTHTSELEKLVNRLTNSGWVLIEKEQDFYDAKGRTIGDIDLLFIKVNQAGMNMLYIEEKASYKERLLKAKRQIHRGMQHIIDTYNPHRVWGFYAHNQEIKRVEVYEK